MMINYPEGVTRRLGKSQGYLTLNIKDIEIDGVPYMISSWQPTPAELEKLAAGAPIYLHVIGTQHPPVFIGVGDAPESPPEVIGFPA